MEFALGRRDAPFVVTYAIWGGGGFFRIKLGQELPATKVKIGVEALEASLEFGFHVGLSLVGGKVSGTVSLMAGIYYTIGEVPGCTGKGAALTGFIRGSGNIKAFGISVSLVLYAGLLYDVSKNEIWAQVSVTVSVELAFFSQSVYVRFDWRLQGSGPTAGPPCMSSSALFGELAGLTAGADARAFQAAAPAPITFEDILSETAWRTEYVTAFAPAAFAGAR
jgi:hypothetical protein